MATLFFMNVGYQFCCTAKAVTVLRRMALWHIQFYIIGVSTFQCPIGCVHIWTILFRPRGAWFLCSAAAPLLAARWKACVGPLSPEHRVLSAALMERLRYAGGRGKAGVVHLQPTLGPQAMRGHRDKGPLHAARRQA